MKMRSLILLLVVYAVKCIYVVNGIFYDQKQSVCCAGTVFPKNVGCCGHATLNPDKEICCGNVVHPKKFGNETECCEDYDAINSNANLYNSSKQICCYETVEPMDIPPHLKKDRVSCCGKPGNLTVYNMQTHGCWKNTVVENGAVCQDELGNMKRYDEEKEIFCNNRIQTKKSKTTECCKETKLYDSQMEKCCNGSVIPFAKGGDPIVLQCCGNKLYNRTNSKCCDGKLFENARGDCCGDELTSYENYACPYGLEGFIESPRVFCGNTEIDIRKQLCCVDRKTNHSSIKDRQNYFTICCGDQIFDRMKNYERKTCCNGEIVDWKRDKVCCHDYAELKHFTVPGYVTELTMKNSSFLNLYALNLLG